MVLDNVKEWLYGCSRCGTCKEVLNIFDPVCPAGERYQLESYFPSGKITIARAVSTGILRLEDDEIRERIYACTGCLSCEQQCGVYHHQHIFETIHAVRTEAVTQGLLNPGYMVMVDNLKKEDNILGKPKAERGNWARDLQVKNATEERVDVLYHTGCMVSFDSELWEAPRSTIKIMQVAGADVGIMAKEESCCGGHAYETGYLGEFTKYAEHFLETVNTLGVSLVVTSCSDGFSTFKTLYPKININMKPEVLHFVEYLGRLLDEDKIEFSQSVPIKATYHDPCHIGRHISPSIYELPRNILKNIPGLELVEMRRNKENAWCCGAGAGVKQSNPALASWTANERLKEAKATGATVLVTACPWCMRNFKDAVQEFGTAIEIYDIAEIIWKAMEK